LRAAIKFQRWKNLISSPSTDNPIPADAPALASGRTTARSGGTREASLTMPIHSSNSRAKSGLGAAPPRFLQHLREIERHHVAGGFRHRSTQDARTAGDVEH
jgi:hypothetical protein